MITFQTFLFSELEIGFGADGAQIYYLHCVFWFPSWVQFSLSVVSDSLQPYGLQHARPPCPSPAPGVYSNSCPLSWWCYLEMNSWVWKHKTTSIPTEILWHRKGDTGLVECTHELVWSLWSIHCFPWWIRWYPSWTYRMCTAWTLWIRGFIFLQAPSGFQIHHSVKVQDQISTTWDVQITHPLCLPFYTCLI